MRYDFTLCNEDQKKYGFSNLVCDAWFGIYEDKFNEKWKFSEDQNVYTKVKIFLTDADIDRITTNAVKTVELYN